MNRQETDKVRKTSKRASETSEQTLNRQETDKMHKTRKRASETSEQTLNRQETDKVRKTRKRASETSIEHAISAFRSETKGGPDFVCTCCHRMMYRKSVIQCNKSKYTKTSPVVLQEVFSVNIRYISNDGKQWICKTCDRALVRNSMPLQSKANGLQLAEMPLNCPA